MSTSRRAEISLANRLDEIPRMLDEIKAFGVDCGLPEKLVFEISLALDELVTNTISYGFGDSDEHRIALALSCEGPLFSAELADDGVAFNPLERAAPKLDEKVEERAIGGLGIHFVRTVMDDISYQRDGIRNRLLMTKRF